MIQKRNNYGEVAIAGIAIACGLILNGILTGPRDLDLFSYIIGAIALLILLGCFANTLHLLNRDK